MQYNLADIFAALNAAENTCIHTVKREFKPHTTSFSLRVGAHPNPSMLLCLKMERHTSPSSLILGCHNFVKHFTIGG